MPRFCPPPCCQLRDGPSRWAQEMLPHPHHAALVLLGWVCVVLCALRYQNRRHLLVELLLESVKWCPSYPLPRGDPRVEILCMQHNQTP